MSGEGFTIGLTLYDARRQRIPTRWIYNPDDNPLIILLAMAQRPLPIESEEYDEFVIERSVLVTAFEHAPRTVGQGVVRFWVPNGRDMRIGLFLPGKPPQVLGASTQAVLSFALATVTSVPMCASPRRCWLPTCAECLWLATQFPWCSCGKPGCHDRPPG